MAGWVHRDGGIAVDRSDCASDAWESIATLAEKIVEELRHEPRDAKGPDLRCELRRDRGHLLPLVPRSGVVLRFETRKRLDYKQSNHAKRHAAAQRE